MRAPNLNRGRFAGGTSDPLDTARPTAAGWDSLASAAAPSGVRKTGGCGRRDGRAPCSPAAVLLRVSCLLLLVATSAAAAPASGVCEDERREDSLGRLAGEIRSVSDLTLGRAQAPNRAPPAARTDAVRWAGIELDDDTLVEGSWSVGGKQPDFWIDYQDPILRERVLDPARVIGARDEDVWKRIERIQKLVRKSLKYDGHENRGYIRHNERLLAEGDRIASLGEYVELKAGVCRENALLTTVALRAAGFDARFGYFKAQEGRTVIGDHAIALVEVEGVTYIVDSFTPFGTVLNGHRLAEMLNPPRNRKYHPSPLASGNEYEPNGYKLVPNDYPRVRTGDYRSP